MHAAVTHSPQSVIKTETTDTTDDSGMDVVNCAMDGNDTTTDVSNEEFLLTVFGSELADARPIMVSFEGNPANAPSSAWFGTSWINDSVLTDILPANANNYFSLAVFRPDEAGHYRRQKARFHGLYAVMLDDVGTKVALERLTVPPTWLIETSAGNYQAGYLLREPLTDGAAADRLMNAIVAAGLCDPGANGPRARLARLPVAINGKHTPPFACRMVNWSPELRYSTADLVHGLQLEIAPEGRAKRQSTRSAQARPSDGDSVWIPRPDENTVLLALRDRGLYKAPLGDGKHDITCPWVQQHTGADERGDINRRKLGWWIRRNAGRIVDGLRFVRASGNRSAEAWQVESVSTVSTVSVRANAVSVREADAHNAYARASPGE